MTIKKQAGDFKNFVLDQLESLPELFCRRMFGCYGIYQGEHFFAIIHQGDLYFKTDGESRTDYEARNMGPFRPSEKITLKNYYQVPVDILEDPDTLLDWARRSVEVSRKST